MLQVVPDEHVPSLKLHVRIADAMQTIEDMAIGDMVTFKLHAMLTNINLRNVVYGKCPGCRTKQAIPLGFRLTCRRCGAFYGDAQRWELSYDIPVCFTDQTGTWRDVKVKGSSLLDNMPPEQWIYCDPVHHQGVIQKLMLAWFEVEITVECHGPDLWTAELINLK